MDTTRNCFNISAGFGGNKSSDGNAMEKNK